ncbi:hypothetical protein Tco_0715206, partial [Tanacetum coccineum]
VSGIVSQSVVNGVGTNGDGKLVPEGVVNGVRINGVRANEVSRAGRESVVNDVGTNGVGELVPKGMRVNGVSREGREFVVNVTTEILAVNGVKTNGVGESVLKDVSNGVRTNGVSVSGVVREPVSKVMANGSSSSIGKADSRFSGKLDKERLLAWFNQEVVDDLGRNCQDAASTIRFWERMQLEDVEKGTRALLMMKETQTKIGEKASFILNLRHGMEEAAVEDSNLAREIDGLCAGLTARIEEREYFIDELDVLVDEFVPKKMTEFIKET